ncbi:hypothetical protein CEXT_487461 [Caerostris extrusa]|uniref:Uncharacterized protein n=1 Tax=Caerostris extrusa TaxID=172846 RepID=A0AAV4MMG3_CAEEX|nr:hypothetical protein CEXT_487461 [Caerostris extrusa]
MMDRNLKIGEHCDSCSQGLGQLTTLIYRNRPGRINGKGMATFLACLVLIKWITDSERHGGNGAVTFAVIHCICWPKST